MLRKIALIVLIVAVLGLSAVVPTANAQSGMTRLRVANMSADAGEVTVYIDGKAAVNALPTGFVSIFGQFEPGEHTVTFAPVGKDESAAITPTVKQTTVETGGYTVVLFGNVADKTISALAIDDGKAIADATTVGDVTDADKAGTTSYTLILNGMSDVKALSFTINGKDAFKDIPFGGYQVMKAPAETYKASILFDGTAIASDVETFNLPAAYNLTVFYGTAKQFAVGNANFTPLPLPDYLKTYSDPSVKLGDKVGTFESFVKALDAAGLTETFNAESSLNTIFVPSDAAFAALGADTLDTLMADQAALAKVLQFHVVPETIFVPNLIKAKSLTTATGDAITVAIDAGNLALNGQAKLLRGTGEMRFKNNLVMYLIDGVLAAK
jgi:uncharacterized surface protein with fasciclin (FAS1) repeats